MITKNKSTITRLILIIFLMIPSISVGNQTHYRFQSPQEFIRTIYPFAKEAAKQIGIDPKVLIAQAAHETNWGKRIPRCKDGSTSFNLFGIKSTSRNPAKKAVSKTNEYQQGKLVKITAGFRAYTGYDEAFADYVGMLKRSKRYSKALRNAHQPYAFLQDLQSAGYATDPRYATKIYDIYKSNLLNRLA